MSQLSPQPSRSPLETQARTVRRLRRFSYLLDSAIRIPGTPYRIGIDPLLDIIPIGGDFIGTALSIYIVIEAARMGASRPVVVQMVSNILFDTVIGTVPVLGTVADAVWKANGKNIELLETELKIPQSEKKADWLFLVLLIGGLLIAIVILAAVSVLLLRWILTAIFG
jgi:hypothetical protein